jgi:flagellar biogenesis protein FliO
MKRSLLLLGVLLSLLGNTQAFALTVLKDVSVFDGERVDLEFDRGIKEKQIKTEFFRDIVQISIKDVAVYPAKIFSVDGPHLKKVFAYQYTPNLIRCRLTVEGDAKKYEGRVKVALKDSKVVISIADNEIQKDQIATQASQSIRSASNSSGQQGTPSKEKSKPEDSNLNDVRDPELLNEVLGKSQKQKASHDSQNKKLTSGKDVEFPLGHLVWILGALGCVWVILFALKKSKKLNRNFHQSEMRRKLAGFMTKLGVSAQMKQDQIRILSNQNLSPSAQLAVVEIEGKRMVLGITPKSINLISEHSSFDSDTNSDSPDEFDSNAIFGAPSSFPSASQIRPARALPVENQFQDLVQRASQQPRMSPPKRELSVRDRIRRRIEEMKAL